MKLTNQLLSPLQHCEDVIVQLVQRLNLKITSSSLMKDLLEHPDYPSLVSIMDVLKSYGVENAAYKIDMTDFKELPLPFIAHIKAEKLPYALFAIVHKIDTSSLDVYNPETRKNEIWNNERLQKQYLGNVLVVGADESSREKEYEEKLKKERRLQAANLLNVFTLPILTLIAIGLTVFSSQGSTLIAPVIFSLLVLTGTAVGALLLWHEVDEYNPALKQICQAGKKVNCSSILNSKASKIFGVSWSSIGFTYFMGMLLSLLVYGIANVPVLQLLGWINVLALPYIGFSIYYQWKVAGQWCVLCLLVQALLLLQFVTAFFGGFLTIDAFQQAPANIYLALFSIFIFVFLSIRLLIPTLEKAKDSRQKTISLQRLKHNPQIFEALLAKQKAIEMPTDGLGITLGNLHAKYTLVKVCNPYCGPCASAHPVVEELLETNEDLRIQILFTATGSDDDLKTPPVRHLLAIAGKGNDEQTKKALDDWYLADKKDYEVFAAKYPMNGELAKQTEKINAMKEWCDATKIDFTPTFFVNGRQLPEMYSVNDLKYFMTS